MTADAGDEQIVVIRDNDKTENATTEEVAVNLETMLSHLHILFTDRRCLLSGYAKYMLDVLSETPITVIVDNKPKIIGRKGGVPDAIMDRCFERTACYVRMARAAAATEFSDFDLLTSFSVYSLSERRRVAFGSSNMNNTHVIENGLERQAAFFESQQTSSEKSTTSCCQQPLKSFDQSRTLQSLRHSPPRCTDVTARHSSK